MLDTRPTFPSLDKWVEMSESEQDALIRAIEKSRRYRWRFLVTAICGALIAGAMLVAGSTYLLSS